MPADAGEALALAGVVATAALAGLLHLRRSHRRRDEARAWLRGVRSVISDDSDAAIAALSDAARLGSDEAIDTYLALGALFRRTGDLARAVRLHRNMLVYPGLDAGRAAEVERELAEDYRRSGMLGEAVELLGRRPRDDRAGAALLRDVLADQGRWEAAAEVQRRVGGEGSDPILAHLLAAAARAHTDAAPDRSLELASRAVAADGRSADARLARAEAEAATGRSAEALEDVAAALGADPRAGVMAWPALQRIPDRAAALARLEALAAVAPTDPALAMLLGRLLLAAGREAEAIEAFRRALALDGQGEVTVAMRDLLRSAASPEPGDLAARHELVVAALMKKARSPRCGRCGAEAPQRAWRCRQCGAFDSF